MKKKETLNKLNLSKDTISVLTSDLLSNVKGGARCPGLSSQDPSDPDYIELDVTSYSTASSLY